MARVSNRQEEGKERVNHADTGLPKKKKKRKKIKNLHDPGPS